MAKNNKIGFARLSPEERAELGRRGGRAAAQGGGHRWDSQEATKATKKRWRKKKPSKK